jgi:O-antigen ligase
MEGKRKLDYLLISSLTLVIVAIPFRPVWGSYSIIILTVIAFTNAIFLKKFEKLPLFVYVLVIVFIVRILWIFRADDFSYAVGKLETEFGLFVFPLIFSLFRVTPEMKTLAVRVYALVMMSIMIYGFYRLGLYFQNSPYTFTEYTLFHLDPAWFWEHSRNFAQSMLTWEWAHYSFINVMLIYGIHLLVYQESKTKLDKTLLPLYAVMAMLFLVYTGSRIGFIAYLSAAIGYALLSFKFVFKKRILFLGIVCVLAFAVTICLIKWGNKIEPIRYHYWSRAVDAIKINPYLGHGTGSAKFIMSEPEFEQKIGWTVNHPHNQYLTELLQFGFIGSIPLFAFFFLGIWHGLTFRDKALISIIITFMVFMITEAPVNTNKGLVPFVLLISILANVGRSSLPNHEKDFDKQSS